MKTLMPMTRIGLASVVLSVTLVGCGSVTKIEEHAESTTAAATSTGEATSTTTKAPDSSVTSEAAGPHRTIQDYIEENHIQETVIKQGDPGPSVDLPVPEGWQIKGGLPEAPYGAIVYPETKVPDNPPRILAIFEKLTGDVDPEEILALAPGELQNIPGYEGPSKGKRDSLDGYDAVQLGGHYNVDGKEGMIAQKTVVIPADDGVYVLQLNAYSDESEADILSAATSIVDENTKITR